MGTSAQPRLFNVTQDGNGDGTIDPEDALENIVRRAIGPAVTGTGRTGLPDRGPNNQVPAVYFHQVSLSGTHAGWMVYEYWLYYADNPALLNHEHDWEAYFVYIDPSRTPRSVRLSAHDAYTLYSWPALQSAGRLDGTHPLLSLDGGSHAFQSPSSGLAGGVRIGWDGSVARRGGQLDQGDGTSPGWLILSNDMVSGAVGYTTAPGTYYYDDPYYLGGSELGDPRQPPWSRTQWSSPPTPQ